MLLSETIDWLLVFIPIIATCVVVSVLLVDELAFFIREQFNRCIIVLKPGVLIYLFDR